LSVGLRNNNKDADGRLRLQFRQGQKFLLRHNLLTGRGVYPASSVTFEDGSFLQGKGSGRQADYTPLSSTEGKKRGAPPPLPIRLYGVAQKLS
jgi:hypothetical protein